MPRPDELQTLASLAAEIETLRHGAVSFERGAEAAIAALPAARQASARNLLHYLAIRQHDIRSLQERLAERGLSSLGRIEPHALASLDAVLGVLEQLAGRRAPALEPPPVDFASGGATLVANTDALLGPRAADRAVRVMVTMSSDAADRYELVRDLVAAGMSVMRINCAHDDVDAWLRMVRHARAAETEIGRRCLVSLDLAGPKLRTGPVTPGPGVLHWWPLRDDAGRIRARARLRIVPADAEQRAALESALPIDRALFAALRRGDVLHFLDTRGRHRTLEVVEREGEAWIGEADRNAYVASGAPVELRRAGARVASGAVGDLPPVERSLRLEIGDRLEVECSGALGAPAETDAAGHGVRPARIGCTLPEVLRDVRPGEHVYFDDGKLGGVVREVGARSFVVEITRARAGRGKLRGDRGINLPDTELRLPALTDKDLADLDFVVRHADLVGLSFARDPADVESLQAALAERGGERLGVILKVETGRAFQQLPRLLLALLRSPAAGVMVARGDLGVELGFERLAEVQEEILWLCEAAHLPVVWATQVLENLAKKGLPSRGEVTDAAMGGRAECVMLNKGPHVVEAVRFLCDVLARMQGHVEKKRALLRELGVSHAL